MTIREAITLKWMTDNTVTRLGFVVAVVVAVGTGFNYQFSSRAMAETALANTVEIKAEQKEFAKEQDAKIMVAIELATELAAQNKQMTLRADRHEYEDCIRRMVETLGSAAANELRSCRPGGSL